MADPVNTTTTTRVVTLEEGRLYYGTIHPVRTQSGRVQIIWDDRDNGDLMAQDPGDYEIVDSATDDPDYPDRGAQAERDSFGICGECRLRLPLVSPDNHWPGLCRGCADRPCVECGRADQAAARHREWGQTQLCEVCDGTAEPEPFDPDGRI